MIKQIKEIPANRKAGVHYIETLTAQEMKDWLYAELRELPGKCHLLAGSESQMDYPVQAIINHYRYLSGPTHVLMIVAIEGLVGQWKSAPSEWSPSAVSALLSLATELRLYHVKPALKSLVESQEFERLGAIQYRVLLAIATLSSEDDTEFWIQEAGRRPKFSGMAFQVLWRITPYDALRLLLPTLDLGNESIRGSVARACPDFENFLEVRSGFD